MSHIEQLCNYIRNRTKKVRVQAAIQMPEYPMTYADALKYAQAMDALMRMHSEQMQDLKRSIQRDVRTISMIQKNLDSESTLDKIIERIKRKQL